MRHPRVTVRSAITHLCPFRPERDLGQIEASWVGVIELAFVASEFTAYDKREITHEELTARIGTRLTEMGGTDVRVVTWWRTDGLDVEITWPPTTEA